MNLMGMIYSGDKRLLEIALGCKSSLVTQCRRNGSLKQTTPAKPFDSTLNGRNLEAHWKYWRREEARRRLGYFTWVRFLLKCFVDVL
jgi:hypothetical protein